MRVKVCGLTLLRDMRLAEAAGAEYVGFVVEAPSPRAVSRNVAAALARAARAKPVFVVVDMPIDDILALVAVQKPAAIQLHGSETADYVRQLRAAVAPDIELWKALAVRDERSLTQAAEAAQQLADAGVARILLDTRTGGRGADQSPTFPLDLAAAAVNKIPLPCIIAGGLTPELLPEIWRTARPWAVDLSSSLEAAPGRKSPARMKALAQAIASTADS